MIKIEDEQMTISGNGDLIIVEACLIIENVYEAITSPMDRFIFTEMLIGSMNAGIFGDKEETNE